MADKADQPVLRRKAGARRASQGLAEMTPPKAMRIALAKAGDAVLHVPVTLRDLKRSTLSPDDLGTTLPEPALILRMTGLGDTVALAVLCPQTVAAVIEAQTMGRVTQGAATERKATATDASMARRFVDLVVEGFSILAEECRGLPAIEGYKVAGRFVDARVAAMALEDADHVHLAAEIDVSSGAKSGVIHFVLPTRHRNVAADMETEGWAAAMEKAVMGSPARLEARLCKIKIPLFDATQMTVGQVVPLGQATLDSVELVATNGRSVMAARLGRSGTMRAVRLRTGDAPARRQALPQEMGNLPVSGAAPASPVPDLPEDDLPMPAPMADFPEPEPLSDLPATLDAVPMAMDIDLPE